MTSVQCQLGRRCYVSFLCRIIGVGGDGLFNELLNGILLQSQYNAGVDLRRGRFIPVQPFIRLGMIPAGATDSIVHSTMGYSNPVAAAAQIVLGEYP